MNCWDRIEPPPRRPLGPRLGAWWRRQVVLRVTAEAAALLAAAWLLGLVRVEVLP